MNSFWLFRTDLLNKEYYHDYNDLETFKLKCHDFYLLQGLFFIENDMFDEVIIWRLSDKKIDDIIFYINNKKFIQKWIINPEEVFKYDSPSCTLFRGGFKFYCHLTKSNPKFFGLKLYLAAGKRILPQYGGIYDKILIEDKKDSNKNSIPFYKTTNQNIFKPLKIEKNYDICLISNFSQLKYKGTDFIIHEISKNNFLKKLKICHIGNNNQIGIELCKKLNVKNIEFLGTKERSDINYILNQSKFSIVSSNISDGCPRVITEILTSGTPLLIRDQTRCLDYYKKYGVMEFNDLNFVDKVDNMIDGLQILTKKLNDNLDKFSMKKICLLNLELWKNNSVV